MSDSKAATDQRTELIRAASQLLNEFGFRRPTLGDVAKVAQVSLGEVYHHFDTKEALAEAVIAVQEAALRERFASWVAVHQDPRARLHCLVRAPLDAKDTVIQFGCPHNSLYQELAKLGPGSPLSRAAAELLAIYLEWTEKQICALGYPRPEAALLATDLVIALQGTLLMARTLQSDELLVEQLVRVERWIDETILEQRSQRQS